MDYKPYKVYLAFIKERRKRNFKRSALMTIFALFFLALTLSGVFYWRKHYADQKNENIQTLTIVQSRFNSTRESIGDLLAAFRVAGAKTSFVDANKEASASAAGYYIALDDLQKNIAKMQTISTNITFAQNELQKAKLDDNYSKINASLSLYYQQNLNTLAELINSNKKAKEFIVASGSNFYLPVLSREDLWQDGSNEAIIAYYQNARKQAQSAESSLRTLNKDPQYSGYVEAQISYLTLVVNVSNNILNTIQIPDKEATDEPTSREKAYQLLVGASRENEQYAQRILYERLKVTDVGRNLANFASSRLLEDSIKGEIEQALVESPEANNVFETLLSKGNQLVKKINLYKLL